MTAGVTREQVMQAIFNLLATAYAFQYTSRRPMTEANLSSSALFPAMFVIDDDEQHKRGDIVAPAVRTITCAAWIFTNTGEDPNAVPATILNNIIDSIDPVTAGVLMPNPLTGHQTLGGLVYDCWIEGKVTKDPGVLGGLGFAHIPISIMMP